MLFAGDNGLNDSGNASFMGVFCSGVVFHIRIGMSDAGFKIIDLKSRTIGLEHYVDGME